MPPRFSSSQVHVCSIFDSQHGSFVTTSPYEERPCATDYSPYWPLCHEVQARRLGSFEFHDHQVESLHQSIRPNFEQVTSPPSASWSYFRTFFFSQVYACESFPYWSWPLAKRRLAALSPAVPNWFSMTRMGDLFFFCTPRKCSIVVLTVPNEVPRKIFHF